MNRLDPEGLVLFFDGRRLEPASKEKHVMGFCAKCGQELESLAYYRPGDGWLVAARCPGDHPVLISYGEDWRWLGDLDLELAASFKSISDLPREQLEAVFSPGEIKAMEACEKGEEYTRQILYRARAKYERFERLFGVKIKI